MLGVDAFRIRSAMKARGALSNFAMEILWTRTFFPAKIVAYHHSQTQSLFRVDSARWAKENLRLARSPLRMVVLLGMKRIVEVTRCDDN